MASATPAVEIQPRQVANKSDKKRLLDAIRMTLSIQSPAIRHNTQTFNRNRYNAISLLPDYDDLKDRARKIKEQSVANLPSLLKQLEESVHRNGGHFYLAPTAADANNYIRDVLVKHAVKLVVKGKSITSEETRLNHVLEEEGIKVAESDLAEFILQVADEQPSHIIAPALHYSRERITALFKSKFKTDLPLDTGEELTKFAREILREQFIAADAGISGANLIAADSGSIMLVESEGNIRMTTTLPPVHIAIAGIEKVIASREDFGTFLELLPASATGQPLTSYVSILHPPLKAPSFAAPGKSEKPREFHMVLIDNGRMRMREDPILHEALYCIRCSACLNSCANFETVGGHAFGGETYSGGIGGSWEAGTGKLMNARFAELCTACSRCVNNCPVRIDIPWLNENLRHRMNQAQGSSLARSAFGAITGSAVGDRVAPLQKQFFGNYPTIGKWGASMAGLANSTLQAPLLPDLMESLFGVDRRRKLPEFPAQTWVQLYQDEKPNGSATANPAQELLVMFADVFTNYGAPQRGMAAIRVLRACGYDVVLTSALSEGRAALSQGMIDTAKQQARATVEMLRSYLHAGKKLVVLEPSSLAMFRRDIKHLIEDKALIELLAANSFEPLQLVWKAAQEYGINLRETFPAERWSRGTKLFYHSHCQQRTCNAASETVEVLKACGFDVVTSTVECCGMAGSFGYKHDYYDLSMAVGEDLFRQARNADGDGERVLVASGISCHEQLGEGMHRDVIHPVEILENLAKTR